MRGLPSVAAIEFEAVAPNEEQEGRLILVDEDDDTLCSVFRRVGVVARRHLFCLSTVLTVDVVVVMTPGR